MFDPTNLKAYNESMAYKSDRIAKIEQMQHDDDNWYQQPYTWQEILVFALFGITALTAIIGSVVCFIWK